MARNPISGRSKSSKAVRSGLEKMQMNHLHTRKKIQRIKAEAAMRLATGKPAHARELPPQVAALRISSRLLIVVFHVDIIAVERRFPSKSDVAVAWLPVSRGGALSVTGGAVSQIGLRQFARLICPIRDAASVRPR
jgi:hypothetical protein